ncbi:MAG: 50S ribosomal protein L24 [Candidatus Paceibacterota bacterium]|jgi:large subunit ribosomal protein L24
MVIAGKDRGKTGKVLEALPAENRILVEGVNVKKRHQRPRKSNEKGQIIDVTLPIHVSNVQLVEGGKPVRAGKKLIDGKLIRVSKKTGSAI